MAKSEKSAVAVSKETAERLRSVAVGVQTSVGDLLALVSTQPGLMHRAYLEGLRADVEARIDRLEKPPGRPRGAGKRSGAGSAGVARASGSAAESGVVSAEVTADRLTDG